MALVALDGDLTVAANITVAAAGDDILLSSSATLDVSTMATLTSTGLAVEAHTLSVTLPASVDRLAANITGTSGFTYSDDDGLTVTTIAVGGHTVTA